MRGRLGRPQRKTAILPVMEVSASRLPENAKIIGACRESKHRNSGNVHMAVEKSRRCLRIGV